MKVCIQLEPWMSKDLVEAHFDVHYGRSHPDAEILFANTKPIDLSSMLKLKAIIRPGAGYDNVPLKRCKEKGIICAYAPHGPSQSAAELTIGLALASVRGILDCNKEPTWNRVMGRELSCMTLGIIGMGRVGKIVSHIGQNLFKDIMWNDIEVPESELFNNVFVESDIVSLHVPKEWKGKTNIDLVTKTEMSIMKDDAILINTSRGGVVNEDDLEQHLKNNDKFKACSDVFVDEPYDGPLLKCPNFIRTCHMGAMTKQARVRMEFDSINAALAIVAGKKPEHCIEE